MKQKRFLLPLLMAIVMMAMSPMKMWAQITPVPVQVGVSTHVDISEELEGAAVLSVQPTQSGFYTINFSSEQNSNLYCVIGENLSSSDYLDMNGRWHSFSPFGCGYYVCNDGRY